MSRTAALQELNSQPWAILPETLAGMQAALSGTADISLSALGLRAASRTPARSTGAIAVLPLWGIIQQRQSFLMSIFGGISTESFAAEFTEAVRDPNVRGIILDVDSPGGSVGGVAELADIIYRARGRKPVVAVADTLMASAAYWIGSQADSIAASPSALVGSIGVFTTHADMSKALDREGVKVTLISAGRKKTEGNSFEPLTAEAKAGIQATVDDYYRLFVGAVARGRGVTTTAVRTGYGEGRALTADPAKRAGLVDRISTLSAEITRMGSSAAPAAGRAQGSARLGAAEIEIRQRRLQLLGRP